MKKTSTNVDMTGFIGVTLRVTLSRKVTLINVTKKQCFITNALRLLEIAIFFQEEHLQNK